MKRSLIVVLTMAMLLFAFAGVVSASEQDDAAERLQGFGVVEGYPDGSMGLENQITRAEFAKIAVVAKGMEEAAELLQGSSSKFSDVAAGLWYTGWIVVAENEGIVNGYPDGTFGPNDNITNAEAVAMILRVLGYNDNLTGAWPNNYLVKGSSLGVTSGIVSNAGANALRGDVFTMLNRALDEEAVRWNSDDADFEERGYTLLQEMLDAKDEDEGWVVGNFRTDSNLDENEIRIRTEDGTSTFELMFDADVDYLLGLEVTVKHDDGDVYYVDVDTEDADILYDTVDAVDEDEVTLYVEDDDFDWADNARVFVNFGSGDVEEGMYGKFVLDGDGDVAFAVLFEFDRLASGVVIDIDDDIIEYVAVDGATEEELDLDDFDDIYVFAPDFSNASVDDIDVDSAIFFWEDDDEVYIIVKNEEVSGNLDRARNTTVRLDGDDYDIARLAVATLDLGDGFEEWGTEVDNGIDVIDDLVGESAYIVLDLNGEAMFISGDVDVTSDDIYGVVTWAEKGRNSEITVFTGADEEVTYVFETRDNLPNELVANHIENDSVDYDEDSYVVAKFELNKDGEIDEDSAVFVVVNADYEIEEVYVADDGSSSIISDSDYEDYGVFSGNVSKDDGNEYVRLDGSRYYISNSTVMIKSLDGDLDPSLQNYEDIVDSSINEYGDAVLFTDGRTSDAEAIIFLNDDFVGTGDDTYFGVVVDSPWRDGSDWYVDIDVFGEGVEEYLLYSRTGFDEGNLVAFTINSNGEARLISGFDPEELEVLDVADRDGNNIRIDGEWIRINSRAVVYELEDGDLEDEVSISRIRRDTQVMILRDGLEDGNADEGQIVAALLVTGEVERGPRQTDLKFEIEIEDSSMIASYDNYTTVSATVYVSDIDWDEDVDTNNFYVSVDRTKITADVGEIISARTILGNSTYNAEDGTVEFQIRFDDELIENDVIIIDEGAITIVGEGEGIEETATNTNSVEIVVED